MRLSENYSCEQKRQDEAAEAMPTIRQVDRYIVPLLQDNDERPSILGTATFCAVTGNHFLVTAAHVLDGTDTLYFGQGVMIGNTSTQVTTTAMPQSGSRDDDTIDLAVLRLTVEQAQRLIDQGREAIAIEDWDVDDMAQPRQRYVFTGFPHSGTEWDRRRRIIDPRRVSANCFALPNEQIERLRLHPSTHIVALYHRRKMQNQQGRMVMAPEPHGMSGGPVWTLRHGSDQLAWVGIGIEYRRENHALIGTRLGAVVALMRAQYPDVASLLRESRNCQFTTARLMPSSRCSAGELQVASNGCNCGDGCSSNDLQRRQTSR